MKKGAFILLFTLAFYASYAQYVKNAEHSIIYHQPGRFAGWPANCGAFIYNNDEIIVGFTEAPYKKRESHNADHPFLSWQARSLDGGKTWTAANPDNYAGDFGDEPELKVVKKPIHFKHPEFALRVIGGSYHGAEDGRAHFFYSYNKGKTWDGPYSFGDILNWKEISSTPFNQLTPRTDFIVNNKNETLLFFSARVNGKFGSDRLFCIKTTDGGQSFRFQGWVVGPAEQGTAGRVKMNLFGNADENPYDNECRAVMSQSQKLSDGSLVSVIRRKFVTAEKLEKHWIDAYQSSDGGKTWKFLSRIADTGEENGNPPAFTIMKDGRLCVVYGERDFGKICVVYSADKGKTWSAPQTIMDGFWSEDMELNDLGYPRVVQRKDGKMVAMYYYSTKEHLHHLRATVWEP